MPHFVPPFDWSDDALRLRQFNYEHWCEHGYGPNLRDVHETLGLGRRDAVETYKELMLGIACTIDPDSLNCPVLRFQPFASFPTQVKAYVDDEFHSYAGCAMEAVAFGNMPPFRGRTVRLESYCMCCLEPLWFTTVDGEIVDRCPSILVHVSSSPYDWCNDDLDHAERFEREVCRRGVVFTLEQAKTFVSAAVGERMWNYNKPAERHDPRPIVAGVKALGVDVTNWGG
jgi:hypothetical protein